MRLFTLCFAAIAAALPCRAESPEAIAEALASNPPANGMTEARRDAVGMLDAWIAQPDSDSDPAVVAYYQEAADRVLALLEAGPHAEDARCFQLYSSSAIVQTPACVYAFDLDQGPNKDLHTTPEEEGVAFRLRDDQVARLADCVDISFHTHEHHDHIDYEITRALLAAGKTVVVTERNKALWAKEPWADKLTTLEQTLRRPHEVGPLTVHVLHDHQWNNAAHTSGTPCNAYLVTGAGGVGVLTKGDINCGLRLYGWLAALPGNGAKVDIVTGSLIYWRGPNLNRKIDTLFAPIWLPSHAWEFTHRPVGEKRGNAAPFLAGYLMQQRLSAEGDTALLTWGEHLAVEGG
ncbi:MAG: MBL fold metallo-hydrolase [Candidatus Hydrogenedentota bacterium]